MSKLRELLKKSDQVKSFGKFFRRTVLNSKYLYFLSTSTKPLSNQYGFDRGVPLDRFFIESFLDENKSDIKGACLEVLTNDYTLKYGNSHVTKSDVLDIENSNKHANIIDDLRNLQKISDNTYDCIILTQVFQFIDDVPASINECHRILKHGGVLLVTLPCLSRADCTSGPTGDFWRFTQASAKYLFEKDFKPSSISIKPYGNARSGIYFYAGLSVADSPNHVLKNNDPYFPTIISVRAIKE